jgi:AcrR family transcriptional regulator
MSPAGERSSAAMSPAGERSSAAMSPASERSSAADGAARPSVAPKVVDAARFVLAEDGPAGATLERIAAAAGVSRMTLHRQGVTKADIVRALAQRFEQEHQRAMWQALVADGTAADRLALALELQCRLSEQNLAVLEALDGPIGGEIFHEPGPDALTRSVFVDPLHRLLLDGAIDGTLHADDPRETATVLYNAVGHTYRHLRTGHGWSAQRARDGVLALVMDGLRAG